MTLIEEGSILWRKLLSEARPVWREACLRLAKRSTLEAGHADSAAARLLVGAWGRGRRAKPDGMAGERAAGKASGKWAGRHTADF